MEKNHIPVGDYSKTGSLLFTRNGSPARKIKYTVHTVLICDIFDLLRDNTYTRRSADFNRLKFEFHQILLRSTPSLEQFQYYCDRLIVDNAPKGSTVDMHGAYQFLNCLKFAQKLYTQKSAHVNGTSSTGVKTAFG